MRTRESEDSRPRKPFPFRPTLGFHLRSNNVFPTSLIISLVHFSRELRVCMRLRMAAEKHERWSILTCHRSALLTVTLS